MKSIDNDVIIVVIPTSSKSHWATSHISFLYVYDLQTNHYDVINISHSDLPKTNNVNLLVGKLKKNVFIFNKSYIFNVFNQSYDLFLLYWLKYGEKFDNQLLDDIQVYYQWYKLKKNINDIIPIALWLRYIKNIIIQFKHLCELNVSGLKFYNDGIDSFHIIEKEAIPSDITILKKFDKNVENLYNNYNFYTSTGRPSNSFNNINLAALDKSNGIRSAIIPLNNSILVEYDYESMHVRLIANLINFDLPGSNLHEYFGRQYFKTPVLGKENYEKSKNLTFRYLYGSVSAEHSNIPFFKAVEEYRLKLWSEFKKNNYVELPISGRKVYDTDGTMTKSKLFNYIIQGLETEHNIIRVGEILKYLLKKKSRLLLYTYDSFLFNIDYSEVNSINDISLILNQNNFFSRVKIGKNYGNMEIWNKKLKI